MKNNKTKEIPAWLYDRLDELGIIPNETRAANVGASDYSQHIIQPWSIIMEYRLNYWDGDIVKRTLRKKGTDPRRLDYEKFIHICKERIRQIDTEDKRRKTRPLNRNTGRRETRGWRK